MEFQNVMVNGLPGNMAMNVAEHVFHETGLRLTPFAFTGPESESPKKVRVVVGEISLFSIENREKLIFDTAKKFIAVDATAPDAVVPNMEVYIENNIPFVMMTTGGDQKKMAKIMKNAKIPAVIAPNMAGPIVAFQAAMEFMKETFNLPFDDYFFDICESHQSKKQDTSGTAKSVLNSFNGMGVRYTHENDIKKERDTVAQRTIWRIPEQYLSGHGYHQYHLISPDGTVDFHIEHNVRGRDIYALGAIMAIKFLLKKIENGETGVFSMIDVLKG